MIRFMLDSDKAGPLKGLAAIVGSYADLVTPAMAAGFAKAGSTLVVFDRGLGDPHGLATIADVERGALTPAQLPALWAKWEHENRQYRTTYCNRSNLAAVDKALAGHQHWRMIATLDGTVHIGGFNPPYSPAVVQCLTAAMLGFHADGSLVLEDSWHRAPVPGGTSADDTAGMAELKAAIAFGQSTLDKAQAALRDLTTHE